MISPRNNRVRAHVCSQNRPTVLYEESMVLRFLLRSSLIKRVLKLAAISGIYFILMGVYFKRNFFEIALTFARFPYI